MEIPLSPEEISYLEEEKRDYLNLLRKSGLSTLLIWLGALGFALYSENGAFLYGTFISLVLEAYILYSVFYAPLQRVKGDLAYGKKVEKQLKVRKVKKTKTGTIFILDQKKIAHDSDLEEAGVHIENINKGHFLKVQYSPLRKYVFAVLKE